MPREIWLLRHGDAEAHDARPDHDRRLTERGEEQARAAGRALAALGAQFALVLASPRVRALDTARLACEALGGEPAVHQPLSAGFDREDALEAAHGLGDDEKVLLVGHEPDFSQVVHDLTSARIDLRKGGVAVVRLAEGGQLVALLRPRELAGLAG